MPKPNLPSGKVAAVAEGYGFDWATVDATAGEHNLTLRLVKDVPVNGRVLDLEGKRVVGARLRVLGVEAYPGEDLTRMLEETRLRGGSGSRVKQWEGPLPGQASVLTVAADGRFHLAGLGRERSMRLIVEGPAIEYTVITVMTRAGQAVEGPKMPEGSRRAKVYPAAFEHLAEPSRPIRGVLRDKATDKPVAGVILWSYLTTHRAQTDREGRYELLGHPKASNYTLYVVPPDGRHFGRRVQIGDTPGLGALTADIALPSGITAQGRVRDKETGKPVAGVRVAYYPLFPNPHLVHQEEYPTFPDALSSVQTGPDGSFTLTVLPGPGVLAAAGQPLSSYRPALVTRKEVEDCLKEQPERANSEQCLAVHFTGLPFTAGQPALLTQRWYHALALINADEQDRTLERDLLFLPSLTCKGTVVGPDGKPFTDVTVIGLDGEHSATTLKSATFTVCNVHPGRIRQLVFYYKDKNLGRYLEVRGEDTEPLRVELQACGSAEGRLVDKGGKAVAGVAVYFCLEGTPPFWPGGIEVKTDSEGRFRAEGLVPGHKYLMTRNLGNVVDTPPQEVIVEPGKKKELGDLVVSVENP
jgi:hypothetical protein